MHTQLYPPASIHSKSIFRTPAESVATCENCIEPLYPTTEITSQCTDRCIIIACNDPDHNEVNRCHGAGSLPCDLVCDDIIHCGDCGGFDELLQCCTNSHSYPSEPKNVTQLSETSPSWGTSSGNISCSCYASGIVSQAETYPVVNLMDHALDVSLPSNSRDEVMQLTPPLSPPITSYFDLSSHNENPEILTCMWGDCQTNFTSMAELVGHVNLEHLRLPSSQVQQTNSTSSPYSHASHLACQWRDCNNQLFPDSISQPSTSDHIDEVLNYLANHLLNDHLGVHDNKQESNMDEENALLQPSNISASFGSISPDGSSPDEPRYECGWQSCELSFNSCDSLTAHISDVHIGGGKAQYECFWRGCNRNGNNGFSSKQKICRHLQSHTGHRPFQCNICQQYFSEAATLQQHMRRHTQEKPYICDYPGCGKTFAITGALTIHKRTHNGQKPFKCRFCEKAFAESSNLSKHLRTHTGARPYRCSEPGCSKSFARPDQLTRHLSVHRKKSPIRT